jgi:hypothetical protein
MKAKTLTPRQRPLQQRIVIEIDLTNRQIVSCTPVGIHLVEQLDERDRARVDVAQELPFRPRG